MDELIRAAKAVQGEFVLSEPSFVVGFVGAALRTATGAVYTGVSIDLACGIGVCAEHAAIAEMLKHREVEIAAIVAVSGTEILPPCGRCRELMLQLTRRNAETVVILSSERAVPLKDLLPEHWLDKSRSGRDVDST